MIILGIETSCDETALSIIESGNGTDISVLADKTLSQIELHTQYGGVFPNMAKREHSRNLLPLLRTVLEESKLRISNFQFPISKETEGKLKEILNREPELLEHFLGYIPTIQKPPIDAIAVTEGPGLEPCLWTGINLAKALSLVWDIPVIPVNHMEGHIYSALLRRTEISNSQFLISNENPNSKTKISNGLPISYQLKAISYPSLSLLISGGHTELVLIKGLHNYEIVGQTRDDAVGEAFDKVARLLGLPYPGGPEISRLAEQTRVGNSSFIKGGARVGEGGGFKNPSSEGGQSTTISVLPLRKACSRKLGELRIELPRPMLHSQDFDFSFSGIKTSVLYLIKKISEQADIIPPLGKRSSRRLEVSESARAEDLKSLPAEDGAVYDYSSTPFRKGRIPNALTENVKREIALEFETAVTEVLIAKTKKAMEQYGAQALLLGGGVVANAHIRREFEKMCSEESVPLFVPEKSLTTDNALMIAVAGLLRMSTHAKGETLSHAKGNLRLS